MSDFGLNLRELISKGMEAIGNSASNIATSTRQKVNELNIGARKKELREQFDVAAARAVAPLNVLCEYLLPYVKTGGCALCWKGPALRDELEAGRRAAHLLGGRLEMPASCPVYGQDWDHRILPIRKTEKTAAAYPRKPGTPKARPLCDTGNRNQK